jgi:hypothetical protein
MKFNITSLSSSPVIISTNNDVGYKDIFLNNAKNKLTGLSYGNDEYFETFDFNLSNKTIANKSISNQIESYDNYSFDLNPLNNKVYLLNSSNLLGNRRGLSEMDLETGNITSRLGDIVSTLGNQNPNQIVFDNSGNLYASFGGGGTGSNVELNKINYNLPVDDLGNLSSTVVNLTPSIPLGAIGLTYDFDNNRLILATGENTVSFYSINIASGTTSLLKTATGFSNGNNRGFISIEYLGNNTIICGLVDGSKAYTFDLTCPQNFDINDNSSYYTSYSSVVGANFKDFMLAGAATSPNISLSSPTASLIANCSGTPSEFTTFEVAGNNLTNPITISTTTGFEVSTISNTSYSNSLSLPPTNGTLTTTTIYLRLTSNVTTSITGTITASSGGTSETVIDAGVIAAPPVFNHNSILICKEGTFPISITLDPVSSLNASYWSTSSTTISVNSTGYVTAGTATGNYTVSYTDACAQTASATVTVEASSSIDPITDGQASYKISNSNPQPQGPLGLGTVIYKGYNGFNYSSSTQPTNPGFYKVNNVDLTNRKAGCPYPFQIFRCTTCPDPVGPR